MRALLLMLALFLAPVGVYGEASLNSDVIRMLDHLYAQGYEAFVVHYLKLDLLEPCTLAVPPLTEADDYLLMAMGGNRTLDIRLTLSDETHELVDTLPDDMPVFRLDPTTVLESRLVIVEALDMTHGVRTDSAAVMWLLRPVDQE
jgi:hypothetical protein